LLSVRPTSLNTFYHLSLFPRFCRYFVIPIRTIHLLAKSPVNINATVRGMITTQESGRKMYLPSNLHNYSCDSTQYIEQLRRSRFGQIGFMAICVFIVHAFRPLADMLAISSRVFIAIIIRRFHVHQGTTCISKLRYILQITTGKIFQQNKTFQSFA